MVHPLAGQPHSLHELEELKAPLCRSAWVLLHKSQFRLTLCVTGGVCLLTTRSRIHGQHILWILSGQAG